MPDACKEIQRRIGIGDDLEQQLPESIQWGQYPAGLAVLKGAPLFPRLK